MQRTLSGNLQIGLQRDAVGRPTSSATRQRTYQWQTGDILSQIEDSLTGTNRYEHDVFGALTEAH